MISEVLLWVIGLILLFPFLRDSGAMGMFYLFGAFTAIFILRNVIAPWIRQRNSRKSVASLRFNVYVAVILCLTLLAAVVIFKKIEEYFHYDPPKPMEGSTGQVDVLVFDSTAERLASGGLEPMVRVWNPIESKHIRNLPAEGQSYYAGYPYLFTVVVYSPDGKLLATGSADKSVRVWNTQNNKLETQLFCHDKPVRAFAFSADGHWFASGGDDAVICVWHISGSEWKRVKVIGQADKGHSARITALAFSPDSKYLASASADMFVKVWQTDNFSWKWTSNAHDQGVLLLHSRRFGQAFQAVMNVTLGTHKIQQRVRNGELVDMHGAAGSLAALGGPGVLIVEEGNVAILMQSGRITRVVGMGITWLDYFERVHMAVPLNSKWQI